MPAIADRLDICQSRQYSGHVLAIIVCADTSNAARLKTNDNMTSLHSSHRGQPAALAQLHAMVDNVRARIASLYNGIPDEKPVNMFFKMVFK